MDHWVVGKLETIPNEDKNELPISEKHIFDKEKKMEEEQEGWRTRPGLSYLELSNDRLFLVSFRRSFSTMNVKCLHKILESTERIYFF